MTVEQELLPRTVSLAVHELRTPVTVVAGYLRMLLREQGGPLTEKQRKMLDEAERSCARIGALVAEMSDFGKLVAGELPLARQDIDMSALLAELASTMHEGHDRGVRLELRGVEQPIMLTGDRTRLSAAFKALMHSVLRERGEPGVIVVDCALEANPAPGWATVAMGDPSLIELLNGAADRTTFDEWRGGTGMALPLARRVIEGHGGQLWSLHGSHSRAASALRLPLRT
jgi:two-component system, cell cycle sensor histidine kinase PleC